ncbi:MAG: DUF4390 domain-containing protein [Nitrospirae bacterium]|nr:DUF4390 domain-containing protein [Nitrospirota bacterium]
MKKLFLILLVSLCLALISTDTSAITPDIIGPETKIINNNIIVTTFITDTADLQQTINSGLAKEIIFTVELMRSLDLWADEFVVSKKIRKIVKYDNLRDQYLTSVRDGVTRTDKKFTDFNKMKDWIFSIDTINIANIKELEAGSYYIRLIVESRSRERLPLIGSLIYFIPEVEMSLAKESPPFVIGTKR